jgi:hypothetical protein
MPSQRAACQRSVPSCMSQVAAVWRSECRTTSSPSPVSSRISQADLIFPASGWPSFVRAAVVGRRMAQPVQPSSGNTCAFRHLRVVPIPEMRPFAARLKGDDEDSAIAQCFGLTERWRIFVHAFEDIEWAPFCPDAHPRGDSNSKQDTPLRQYLSR